MKLGEWEDGVFQKAAVNTPHGIHAPMVCQNPHDKPDISQVIPFRKDAHRTNAVLTSSQQHSKLIMRVDF